MRLQRFHYLAVLGLALIAEHLAAQEQPSSIRIATFNVSIEASNYSAGKDLDPKIVQQHLASSDVKQLSNIAEIIQRVRPDILLLNEFDYIENANQGIVAFIKNYLNRSQEAVPGIEYPYWYVAPVNTGLPSPYDLDNDGKASGLGADAWGYGLYPGQYGMALLSRYPIDKKNIRTFQNFLWKDLPGALRPMINADQEWYSDEEWSKIPLSSKSHWDIPISTPSGTLHIVAAHPTPPSFDGAEDRNGKRNHDEIRLINDYLSGEDYIYDDNSNSGGLAEKKRFVVLGDLNSSADEGDSIQASIKGLLSNPMVNATCKSSSLGGQLNKPDNPLALYHTAAWGLQVDYVLPSDYGLLVKDCGVFWPEPSSSQYRLVTTRSASSDHRLVWVDLEIINQ